MPIITKPSPLEKDATGVFTLDKTALALHPLVSGSAHFSSPNVWDKIIVKYKSETLGQFESIEFEASAASPEGQFFVSATAEDVFEVEKITIIDKDGAILLIPRADLTVAEFDIDFNAAPPVVGDPVIWDTFLSGATPEADGGISGGGQNLVKSAASKITSGGDYTLTYKFTNLPSPDLIHGIMNSESDTGFTGLTGITYQQSSVIIYYNYAGSEYGPRQSINLVNVAGENTIVIQKVGTVFTFSLNGTVLINESNHTNQVMVPTVRTWGAQALDSAYVD